jgi:tRNA G18 (ribose-2'-O)-methylase SpoU
MQSLIAILPNIRSLYNIGAIFRIADAVGIEKIYLTGYSGRPDKQPKIAKTALGAQDSVPWEYVYHTWQVIEKIKKQGYQIVGLEKNKSSLDYRKFKPKNKIALIVGNEKTGISHPIQKRCDQVIHLPMKGIKESLNVAVAFGIISYHLKYFT